MEIYQQIYRSAKILLLASIVTVAYATDTPKEQFDDWIVSDSCSRDTNKLCGGYYKQPDYPHINKLDTSKQPITITADEANLVSKGTSVFNGKVVTKQADKYIYADKATVIHNQQSGELETITATGRVKIMQPGLRVDGTNAVAHLTADRKIIDNAVYRIYAKHARGWADSMTLFGADQMQLIPATYTTCAPDSNAWHLKAARTNFDKQTGLGEAWHAKLYVKDVPVFYMPYLKFPIDNRRLTGFLPPSYSNSSFDGKTFIAPFYWNIAPNYDAMIRTNYMSLRGLKIDTLWRYLTTSSNGSLNLDFLPSDRGYRALRNKQYANASFMQATASDTALRRNDLKPRDLRYRYSLNNTTNLTKNLLLNIDYTDASDGNYLNDFKIEQRIAGRETSTLYALQRGSLQYRDHWGTVSYNLEQHKTFHIVNGPSGIQQLSKLPEVNFNSSVYNLSPNLISVINANFTKFKPRIVSSDSTLLNYGQRLQARPAISYIMGEPGWFVQPRLQLNYVQYSDLHISRSAQNTGIRNKKTQVTIPMYDMKTGLIFDRQTHIANSEFIQTLEPQAYYLFVPDKNQQHLPNFDSSVMNFDYNQVFRDNSYSGLDRVARANQIGLGLATKLYNYHTGDEQGMLGIGRILYLRDNVVPLNETGNIDKHWSPMAGVAKLMLTPGYNLEGNLVRDKTSTKTASLQLQRYKSHNKVINFGYQFIRNGQPDDLNRQYLNDLKQLTVSTAWQMTAPLRLLGKVGYDLRFHHGLNLLAGLEYHTCCTALRVIWTKKWDPVLTSKQYRYSLGLQIIFKGLGDGLGTAESRYIESEIPGYKAR